MTESNFRIILGGLLLGGLYFDLSALVWSLIGISAFQGVTNWRIPVLVSRLRYGQSVPSGRDRATCRLDFEAERMLSLLIAVFLIPTFGPWNTQLWIVPWFIGFALFGAGLSGICPMVLGLKWLGFR
jgi:hypothetical protein